MDIEQILFVSEMDNKLKGLELQKTRTMARQEGVSPVHDADLYMVIARRLYREIENAEADSRVGNLKGKKKDLLDKIKIRDHFEHGFDPEKLPSADAIKPEVLHGTLAGELASVKIATSVFKKDGNTTIVSGGTSWNLDSDHKELVETIQEFVKLFPFKLPPPSQTGSRKKCA